MDRLVAGESCALVTDAGTPAISDPGEDLVALCAQHDIPVEAVPGPCALICALSVSGLPTARFTFEGFLPQNKKNRRSHLDSLKGEQRTMVFYEAPHKLEDTLEDFVAVFGAERRIALCRELTKLHEEVVRTTVGQALADCATRPPRGEYVLVVEGAPEAPAQEADPQAALERVAQLRGEGLSLKEDCAKAGEEFGIKKRQLYDMSLGK